MTEQLFLVGYTILPGDELDDEKPYVLAELVMRQDGRLGVNKVEELDSLTEALDWLRTAIEACEEQGDVYQERRRT